MVEWRSVNLDSDVNVEDSDVEGGEEDRLLFSFVLKHLHKNLQTYLRNDVERYYVCKENHKNRANINQEKSYLKQIKNCN